VPLPNPFSGGEGTLLPIPHFSSAPVHPDPGYAIDRTSENEMGVDKVD